MGVLAGDAASERPLVIIVHSYEKNHVCGQPQADGVIEALEQAGYGQQRVEVREFFMDTKKTHTTPEAIAERGRLALEQVRDLAPDVVVVLDDNAFKTVGLALAETSERPVVFSGMNGQPEAYNKVVRFMESRERPGRTVTGVYEKLHLKRALSVMARVLPRQGAVVGITDYSPTGEALTRQLELEAAQGLPLPWEVRRVRTFEEYQTLIRELNQNDTVAAIYPVALTLPTAGGGRVTAPEIFAWTIEHSVKPEIPLNYYFCKMGLFGGASVDFKSMGKHAGMLAAAILAGREPGELAIIEAPDYAIVFNVARAEMLGLIVPEDILLASDAVFQTLPLKGPSADPAKN
ncbi:MAG: ABC transporter substrate-binding protein [Desulfovibrionaceae bacterium]